MSLTTGPLKISLNYRVLNLHRFLFHPLEHMSYQVLQCTSYLFLSCPIVMKSLIRMNKCDVLWDVQVIQIFSSKIMGEV